MLTGMHSLASMLTDSRTKQASLPDSQTPGGQGQPREEITISCRGHSRDGGPDPKVAPALSSPTAMSSSSEESAVRRLPCLSAQGHLAPIWQTACELLPVGLPTMLRSLHCTYLKAPSSLCRSPACCSFWSLHTVVAPARQT